MTGTQDWGPLSREQLRLWVHSQLHPEDTAYIVRSAKQFAAVLSFGKLRLCVERLLSEHPVLTWTFHRRGALVERRATEPDLARQVVAIHASSAAEIEGRLADIERGTTDLAEGPLFRVVVAYLGAGETVVCLLAHHIVVDAWSTEVLWRDLATLYNGGDYANAERESYSVYAERESAIVPSRPASAAVPGTVDSVRRDYESAPDTEPDIRHLTIELPSEAGRDVDAAAARYGVTPFTVLLAAFGAAIRRYDNRVERLALATHISTRLREELADTVGFFIRTVPIVLNLEKRGTVADLLTDVCAQLIASLDPAAPNFDDWTAAHGFSGRLGENPASDICFQQLTHAAHQVRLEGSDGVDFSFSGSRSHFGLSVMWIARRGRLDAPIGVQVAYDATAYGEGTVETICAKFVDIARELHRLPDTTVERMGAGISRSEAVAGTRIALKQAVSVWDRLESFPENGRIAVSGEDGTALTVSQLLARARRIAVGLQRKCAPGDRIAIATADRLTGILATLACWRVGCTVAHISPDDLDAGDQPLRDLDVKAVLADERTGLTIDALSSLEGSLNEVPPPEVAYLIATSGTTRASVWVERSMAVLESFLEAGCPRLGADWCVIQTPRLSFDPGIRDTFLTLCGGAELFLGDGMDRDPAETLARAIELGHGDAIVAVVPSILHAALVRLRNRAFSTKLHMVRCVGEPAPRATAALCRDVLGTDPVIDYGTTEAAMISLSSAVPADEARTHFMPLGTPLPPSRVLIADERGDPVDRTMMGEIVIAGPHVASRYVGTGGRDSLVRLSTGEPAHRTGDLGYLDDRGVAHWAGRIGSTVKIRGRMVDLQQIQRALARYPEIDEAHAYVAGEGSDARLMVAFSAVPGARGPAEESIRAQLYRLLGARGAPSRVVRVDRLPRSRSGKIRASLLPQFSDESEREGEPPRTDLETEVASCFARVLGCPDPLRLADFFALGGHSMDAIRLAPLLSARLGVEIDVRAVFENPTVAGMSLHAAALKSEENGLTSQHQRFAG